MNDWFDWNGVRCTEYGIHVTEMPSLTVPAERVSHTTVPGRPGSLTSLEGEDVYDDMLLSATCVLDDPARIPIIAAWLKGSGTVTFANRWLLLCTDCKSNRIFKDLARQSAQVICSHVPMQSVLVCRYSCRHDDYCQRKYFQQSRQRVCRSHHHCIWQRRDHVYGESDHY